MFNSTVLEVAIGMIFCYCGISLVSSAIFEAIASMLKLRSRTLLSGVQALLNDKEVDGLVVQLYNHAAINPNADGEASSIKSLTHKPSYIDPKQFAHGLLDILHTQSDLASAIQALPNAQLKKHLNSLYQRAAGDAAQFESHVATWFDSSMDRVAGAYKRQTQLWTVLIALVLAIALNIDSFRLFAVLWAHPTLALALSSSDMSAATTTLGQIQQLNLLPVGWSTPLFDWHNGLIANYNLAQVMPMTPGWLVTALSALFGAPFWFDLLQRASNIRGTGPKTAAKTTA